MPTTTSSSRIHALFQVAEEEIINLDTNGDGRISLDEVASMIKRLFLRLDLPWYLRMIVQKRLIVLALEKALTLGSVRKREAANLTVTAGRSMVFTEEVHFVDEEAREETIQEILNVRPAAVDSPEEVEAAFKTQLDRNEKLLKMLRSQKANNSSDA